MLVRRSTAAAATAAQLPPSLASKVRDAHGRAAIAAHTSSHIRGLLSSLHHTATTNTCQQHVMHCALCSRALQAQQKGAQPQVLRRCHTAAPATPREDTPLRSLCTHAHAHALT
jgi:hypothetical protein